MENLKKRIYLGEDSYTQFKVNITNSDKLAEELVAFSTALMEQADSATLFSRLLESVVGLTQAEKGFVIVLQNDTHSIAATHNIEKIKTIGDAYMCAGGIPVANTSNPLDVVKAGLEIREFMNIHLMMKAALKIMRKRLLTRS